MFDLPQGSIAKTRVFEFRRRSDKRERGRLRSGASTKLRRICRRRRRLIFLPAFLQKVVTKSQQASQRVSQLQNLPYASDPRLFHEKTATDKNLLSSPPLASSNPARHSSGIGIINSFDEVRTTFMFRWLVAIFCFFCLLISLAIVALSFRSMRVSDNYVYTRDRIYPHAFAPTHRIILQSRDRCLHVTYAAFLPDPKMFDQPHWIRVRTNFQSVSPFFSANRGPFYFYFQALIQNPQMHAWILTFPLWPLAVAMGMPWAIWVVVHRRRIQQYFIEKGLCLNCGYDLRATPNRCPECGTIPRPA
jgi:hypothetical protein